MTIDSDIGGERCDDETKSVLHGIVRGEVPESQLETGKNRGLTTIPDPWRGIAYQGLLLVPGFSRSPYSR